MRRVTRIQKESRSGQGYLSHENCESPRSGTESAARQGVSSVLALRQRRRDAGARGLKGDAEGLDSKDLRGVLAYTTELLRVEQCGQVAPTMLAGLADVVGGDSACLTHLDLVSRQQVAIRRPSVVSDRRMIGAYPTVGHTHPLRAPLHTLARKPPASLDRSGSPTSSLPVPGGRPPSTAKPCPTPPTRSASRWHC